MLYLRHNTLVPSPLPMLEGSLKVLCFEVLQLSRRFCFDGLQVIQMPPPEAPSCISETRKSRRVLNQVNKEGTVIEFVYTKLTHYQGSVCRGIAVIEDPLLLSGKNRANPSHTSFEAPQNFKVEIFIKSLPWRILDGQCPENQRKQSALS